MANLLWAANVLALAVAIGELIWWAIAGDTPGVVLQTSLLFSVTFSLSATSLVVVHKHKCGCPPPSDVSQLVGALAQLQQLVVDLQATVRALIDNTEAILLRLGERGDEE